MDSSLKNNPSQALRGIENKSTMGQSISRQGYVILKLGMSGLHEPRSASTVSGEREAVSKVRMGLGQNDQNNGAHPFVAQLDKSFPLIFSMTVPSPGPQRLKCIRAALEPHKIPGSADPALGMALSYGKCPIPVLYLLKASEHIGDRARLLGSWCPAFS